METKWRVFRGRAERKTICEYCLVNEASDLHEVLSRDFYPPEFLDEVPDELLSCLCNHCNLSVGDSEYVRYFLLGRNVGRYGVARVRKAIDDFAELTGSFVPERVFPMLYTEIDQ